MCNIDCVNGRSSTSVEDGKAMEITHKTKGPVGRGVGLYKRAATDGLREFDPENFDDEVRR